jgi:hypothetical protein
MPLVLSVYYFIKTVKKKHRTELPLYIYIHIYKYHTLSHSFTLYFLCIYELSLCTSLSQHIIKKSISKVWLLTCPSIYQSISQSKDQSSNRIYIIISSCHPLHYPWTTSLLPSNFVMSTATFVTPSLLYILYIPSSLS